MTIKLPSGSPGQRILVGALASTLLVTGIGLSSSVAASERQTLDAGVHRRVLDRRNTPDSGQTTTRKRSSSTDQKPVYTLSNQRTGNTPRQETTRRSGNTERDAATGSYESLNWSAPMTRADGSKLYPGEIEGYRIYYRARRQKKFRTIDIDDASLTSFKLNRFQDGVYEFSVTTLDTNGLESRRSPVVSARL